MALTKQKLPTSFSQGINTKVDDNQKPLGTFNILENIIFDDIFKFRKRYGYDTITLKDLSGTDLVDPRAITVFDQELCLYTDKNFYSYSSSIERWTDKGKLFNIFPTSEIIIRNNKEQKNLDSISVSNINIYSYEDSSGVRLTIQDSVTGNMLLTDQLISSTGSLPKLANIQNDVFISYVDGTNLNYKKVNLLFPTSIGSEQTIVSNVDAAAKYDNVIINDKVVYAYNASTSGGELTLIRLNNDESLSSGVGIAGEVPSEALSLSVDSMDRVLVSYYDGTDVKFTIRSVNLTTELLAPTTIETIANINNVESIETSDEVYTLLYEEFPGVITNSRLKKNTITLAASVGTPEVLFRGVALASKIFEKEDNFHFLMIHNSTLQPSYFLANLSGDITARISYSLGGDNITENGVPKVNDIGDDKFLVTSQVKGRTVTDDGTFYSLLGVKSTIIDFDLKDPFQNKILGDNLHTASGYLNMYDGKEIVEHGFHLFPEDIAVNSTPTTGGVLSDGNYSYIAVYAWTDNKGNIHRSAPSVALNVTLSGGTATQVVNIAVPSLRLTNKENVVLELYRTENNGTIYYRVTDVDSPNFNDKTVDSINIADDSIDDTDLISREILYTTGGVLENIAAPSSSIIESYKNRIFLAGLEDENRIEYSKIRQEDGPVEFNDTLLINVNADGGPITGLKVLDDKLIIFKRNALFFISGDGPNNLGEQDTFIEPQKIASDVGCVDTDSITQTPLGIFFKSEKGIYLLDRSLATRYIGAPVERFNNLTITSGEVVPNNNQIRFTTETGECLVYDFLVNQWVTFTNHKGLSATTLNSDYYYLRPDGQLFKENRNSFTDNGSHIQLKFETGWISFGGLQGYKRVYNMLVLGNFKSKHKVKVEVAYDFKNAFIHESLVDTDDFLDATAYGDYSPYGDPTTVPYGTDAEEYQYKINFKKQKCQSIKIRLYDIQETAELGEGLSLSNMSFQVGVKSGNFKVDQDKYYGADNV